MGFWHTWIRRLSVIDEYNFHLIDNTWVCVWVCWCDSIRRIIFDIHVMLISPIAQRMFISGCRCTIRHKYKYFRIIHAEKIQLDLSWIRNKTLRDRHEMNRFSTLLNWTTDQFVWYERPESTISLIACVKVTFYLTNSMAAQREE